MMLAQQPPFAEEDRLEKLPKSSWIHLKAGEVGQVDLELFVDVNSSFADLLLDLIMDRLVSLPSNQYKVIKVVRSAVFDG